MTNLEAVNIVLAALGESQIMSEISPNPTVGLVLQSLETQRNSLLAQGWYFNNIETTLNPDQEGNITIPYDCVDILSQQGIYQRRGNRLFDLTTYSYCHKAPVKLRIYLDVQIEDMPEPAAQCIAYSAAAEMYSNDLGADQTYNTLLARSETAVTLLKRVHLRQTRPSTRKSKRYQRILSHLTT